MSLQDASDKAALCLGTVTTAVLAAVGCSLPSALLGGGLVALLIDAPFGSISHMEHHGTIGRGHVSRGPRPRRTRMAAPQPTGYPRGSFARL